MHGQTKRLENVHASPGECASLWGGEGIWVRAKGSLAQAMFLGLFDELGFLHSLYNWGGNLRPVYK